MSSHNAKAVEAVAVAVGVAAAVREQVAAEEELALHKEAAAVAVGLAATERAAVDRWTAAIGQ